MSLTWRISADVAGVFIRNILLQKAHAGAMLPAQTLLTLTRAQTHISYSSTHSFTFEVGL